VIKPQPDGIRKSPFVSSGIVDKHGDEIKCPYSVGMRLWVKETHYLYGYWEKNGLTKAGKHKLKFVQMANRGFRYTDDPPTGLCSSRKEMGWFKRSSLFMPRRASRITLEVTGVRVEQVQDITVEDVMFEGTPIISKNKDPFVARFESFQMLWDSINGDKYPWDSNPYVWVIQFKRVQ